MTRAALVLLLVLAAGPGFAQNRPDSLVLTCQHVQALVAKGGAVVVQSGPHFFDRYVASQRFCPVGDVTRPMFVKTKDKPACQLSVCEPPFQVN